MFRTIQRASVLSATRKTLWLLGAAYCGVVTFMLVRFQPKPVLIGIDQYGTRVIRDSIDRLLQKEKENFLKRFLSLMYSYDAVTFEKRVSEGGDAMAKELWDRKRPDFETLALRLKSEPLLQTAEIQEVREIDEATFQADILVRVQRKLVETKVRLRVEIRLRQSPRKENNPYPFEVESYEEQQA